MVSSDPEPQAVRAILGELHRRLEAHFASLGALRARHTPPIPVFALEHGLAVDEIDSLKQLVRAAVRIGAIPREDWLPFVLYAAELGYEYSGDEYWQTFEANTPGWLIYGDRDYVRRMFRRFQERFGGAQPSGRWAQQFSIICWPITHAVLPTDLQRHLARLLFDYRTGLTTQLLADPSELGRRLAARAWIGSSRFENFAQNTDLLGQVAAALLVGDDNDSPYLLGSTLHRIASDLSREREAKTWLRDAKSVAIKVLTRGFRAPDRRGTPRTSGGVRLPQASDPSFFIRREDDGWATYLELEDLSALAERLPSAHQELGRLRARVNGAAGPPLARGRLLFPNQTVQLAQWPASNTSLLSLEGGSDQVNRLLADQCVVSPGPRWVFRVRDDGTATEVRGKFVRPGREYVVLSVEALPVERPEWVTEVRIRTEGVFAYAVSLPNTISPKEAEDLKELRLGTLGEVAIRPAGIVPAMWDGEGAAEWMAGDDPIVAISSSIAPAFCQLIVDGNEELIRWPKDEKEIFLRLSEVEVGSHEILVTVIHDGHDAEPTQGIFSVVVRPPSNRPPSGTVREGFLLLPTPANPTLDELWKGSSSVLICGPRGRNVTLSFKLQDESGRALAAVQAELTLPVDEAAWAELFQEYVYEDGEIQANYDQAQSLLVAVSEPTLSSVSFRAEREFAPLRWATGVSDDSPFVRLINNTGEAARTSLSEFLTPDEMVSMPVSDDQRLRHMAGGLVMAETASTHASTILPPTVRNFGDLQALRAAPRLSALPRSADSVLALIRLATRWISATLPGNPFGASRRNSVVRAIGRALVCLVAGDLWARIEWRIEKEELLDEGALQNAIGDRPYHRALARDLGAYAHQFKRLPTERRASLLAIALAASSNGHWLGKHEARFGEFLLRLASDPASLAAWPQDELRRSVQRTLDLPVLLRAARYIVLVLGEDLVSSRIASEP